LKQEDLVTVDWYENLGDTVGPVLLDAATINKRIRELGDQITRDYQGKAPHLIGILRGATVFLADLLRSIKLGVTIDFIAVESYGDSTTSSGKVRILKDLCAGVAKKDVILVEDILDTGYTLNYLLANLGSREPSSIRVVALLSKPSRRIVEVEADYIGFEIPNEFVIGYGLDFNQRYRNLPDIRILHPGTESVTA